MTHTVNHVRNTARPMQLTHLDSTCFIHIDDVLKRQPTLFSEFLPEPSHGVFSFLAIDSTGFPMQVLDVQAMLVLEALPPSVRELAVVVLGISLRNKGSLDFQSHGCGVN